jgi:hypothetical protein
MFSQPSEVGCPTDIGHRSWLIVVERRSELFPTGQTASVALGQHRQRDLGFLRAEPGKVEQTIQNGLG